MNPEMSSAPDPLPEQPKKTNTWLIVVIVLVVLCCLCAIFGAVLWQYGDQIIKTLGIG